MSDPIYVWRQNGVVLFIALIALVVMSLAAVALIRSVDTNSMVAGNLAFKQSATVSADNGMESAILWIKNNDALLNNNSPINGYYATCNSFDSASDNPCGASNLATTTWTAGVNSRYATAPHISNGVDPSGNRIEYIVQRMCTAVGAASDTKCLYGAIATPVGGNDTLSGPECCPPTPSIPSPAYRVTSKVLGPKNTISYVQTYIY